MIPKILKKFGWDDQLCAGSDCGAGVRPPRLWRDGVPSGYFEWFLNQYDEGVRGAYKDIQLID